MKACALLLLAALAPASDSGFGLFEDDGADDRNTFDLYAWHRFHRDTRPDAVACATYTMLTSKQDRSRCDEAAIAVCSAASSWCDLGVGAFYQGSLGGDEIQSRWHRITGEEVYNLRYAYDKGWTTRGSFDVHLHWGPFTADTKYLGDAAFGRVGCGVANRYVGVEVWARNWWGHDFSPSAREYHDTVGKVGVTIALRGDPASYGTPAILFTACSRDVRFGVTLEW